MFLLMNEEGITYEEYERRMASAIQGEAPEVCILFLIDA